MRLEPRTFVVLGDSEAALSAIDSLKQVFAGKIIVITQSPFGMFENIDVLRRKMRPLTRNEVYYVDEDFFDRNEIDLRQNQVEHIDVDERLLYLKGEKKPLEYDRILIAWGSHKAKLEKQYSNAHYLEDRHAHAKCHNELVKANKIVVLGKTLEAY